MTPGFPRLVPKLGFEFLFAAELMVALHQTTAKPKMALTEQVLEPPLRRRAELPAKAAAELECGALTEPRITT